MTTREFYESIGASYDSVLVRFGSEKMITKFAKRFADELYKASYDLTEDLRDGELSGYEQDYEKVCEKYKIVYDNVTKIDN